MTNLSAMRQDAARRYLASVDGPTCLAYRHRPNGDIIFASEVVRRRDLRSVALAGAAALASACATTTAPSGSVPAAHDVHAEAPPAVETAALVVASSETPRPATAAAPTTDRGADAAGTPVMALECETLRQLFALGGYDAELPERCREDENP